MMSTDSESRMSSPVGISATPSLLSEIDPPHNTQSGRKDASRDSTNKEFKMPEMASPYEQEPPPVPSIWDRPTVIDLGDGDMELKVNNTVFKTHKHLLKDFSRLKEILKGMERCQVATLMPCVAVYRDERGVEDFRNTFKIIYASLIKGPFEFETPVLISALRIATAYGYPELRTFTINRLEANSLPATQRIELASEFNLPEWKDSAFKELCTREEAISKEEACVLGPDLMEEIARAREEEKQRKGKEIGVQEQKEAERAKREAEEQAKRAAEEQAKKEKEERQKKEAEEKARKAKEEKAKKEAEEKAKKAKEEKAKKEAEEKAKKAASKSG